jgi:hypothetical protein
MITNVLRTAQVESARRVANRRSLELARLSGPRVRKRRFWPLQLVALRPYGFWNRAMAVTLISAVGFWNRAAEG